MENSPVVTVTTPRVRFAPSPTGLMHLGGVRTALINFLFARQMGGAFVLRLEDTDAQRNFDPNGKQIMADLAWLGLFYDEGPDIGGPYGPYMQSERAAIYGEYLRQLEVKNKVYTCFCTSEELEKKRQRQIALKTAPRYDRTCARLSTQERQELLKTKPFIWRFNLEDETEKTVEITDLARGVITYDLKHFSDFPLTRADGSFTFIFANFVDDATMLITHIFRGEDHLTNTALQALLYRTFEKKAPIFWHLPIICNSTGKKLSKRDFGFSLGDLHRGGFLPEAINNYLTIIGGGVFKQEIMDMQQLIGALTFEEIHATGGVKYDLEKLRWLNHKWIMRLSPAQVTTRCLPFLIEAYPQAAQLPTKELERLIETIQPSLITLTDSVTILKFYFQEPYLTLESLKEFSPEARLTLTETLKQQNPKADPDKFITTLTQVGKTHQAPSKELFKFIRFALTGSTEGLSVKELFGLLPEKILIERLRAILG